jgi:hypothetical protein
VDTKARTKNLEGFIGRWVYVTPIAPATAPPNYPANDPLSPPFVNSWVNVAGEQPVSFRLHPATRVEIRGAVTGGTIPSTVFTLPDGYRPPKVLPIIFPSADSMSVYTGQINPNGDVQILGSVAGSGSAGIFYEVANVGDWLYVETTSAGGPFTFGMDFELNGGSFGVFQNGSDQLALVAGGGGVLNILAFGGALTVQSTGGGLVLAANGGGTNLYEYSGGGVTIFNGNSVAGAVPITVKDFGTGGIVLDTGSSGSGDLAVMLGANLNITGLPTVNPGGTGNVWNSGGTLKIT